MALRFNQATRGAPVKIEGLTELKAALAELSDEVATKIGVAADRKAARLLANAMIAIAPYNEQGSVRSRTSKSGVVTRTNYGHLRDNIRVRRARAKTAGKVVFTINTGNAFWGYFLEYGTVNMEARPFMRPAFDAFKDQAIDVQISELKSGIEKVARKAKKGRAVNAKGRSV